MPYVYTGAVADDVTAHWACHIERVVVNVGVTMIQLTADDARRLASQLDTAADRATLEVRTPLEVVGS